MASTDALSDPLLSLRRSLASSTPPFLTTSSDPSPDDSTEDFTAATHLYLSHPVPRTLPLESFTRFISSDTSHAVDLRSIYFAWQKKDVAIPEYIASTEELNQTLPDDRKLLNLKFVERLDLITWLEGASEENESEYIKPLEGLDGAKAAEESAQATGTVSGSLATAAPGATVGSVTQIGGRPVKVIDPRLQEIYNGERKMGDRNTVLRGIKPTDFSHIRKTAETFLGRHRRPPPSSSSKQQPSRPMPNNKAAPPPAIKPAVGASPASTHTRRPDPIILLSPSASSLLRMSNIKSFLSDGLFVPPQHPLLASSNPANLLHITRPMRSIDPSGRPIRFILVDSPDQFKPDYWNRVVAVFTTGQTWQFKSYRWSSPPELFKNVPGVYLGFKGEEVPKEVRGWGRGVGCFGVERWDEKVQTKEGRWRDREVVEGVWGRIEMGMRGNSLWKTGQKS